MGMTWDLPDGLNRMYLRTGTVSHAVNGTHGAALCGRTTPWWEPDGWLGTGGQQEYENAASLPPCKQCVARLLDTHSLPVMTNTERTHP